MLRDCHLAVATGLLLIAGLASQLDAKRKATNAGAMDEQKRAVHALNRLTFGPRPGDVQRVTQIGVDKWIDAQLHPERIDDTALQARLAPFRTLRMNTRELVENFPPNQVIRQVANGRADLPNDPAKRAVYEAQLQRYENRKDRKEETTGASRNSAADPSMASADGEKPISDMQAEPPSDDRQENRRAARRKIQELLAMPADQRLKEILQLPADEQLALASDMNGQKADALMEGMTPQQKETLMALENPERVVIGELTQAKLLRAVYSERQLDEVMTDFWFNHFNIFINKGSDRILLTSYERDVIRPHALGKFEDLLVATAQSPAMLFYLDNWLSVGPDSEVGLGIAPRNRKRSHDHRPGARPAKGKAKTASGLNENYGRELMELHTLSVNGGYSQQDVTEVAKVFTGWTIEQPKNGAGFHFDPRMHEPGTKMVLGHKIKENGEKEGLEVLRMLARNPKTAHFISQKLAMRFVADDPPPTLVDRMAQTFLKKHGDIREVLRTMFASEEFWTPEAYRAKVKTPLEFVVSAVRASGAQVDDPRAVLGTLNTMGMAPYAMQPPTGYSMKSDAWVNSSALLGRMNFALGMAAGKVRGVAVDTTHLAPAAQDAQQTLAALENSLLAGDVSKQTHDTISQQLDDPKISQQKLDDVKRPPNVAAITGLILGSPEFQRR
ncbi:MAG: DUF1800 domain-containing protein [Acidobacteria bacterium]|nr:DUF1800 domain-containing protein [Acidobacteriota bacterium]